MSLMTNSTKAFLKIGTMLAVLGSSIALAGCGCGVGPDQSDANVNDKGAVEFAPTAVGSSETLTIPIRDSANTDETITGASFEGQNAAAFQVLTTFPLFVPAGTDVNVDVQFTPRAVGSASATLVLQTEMMGPSPVDLEGVGEQQ